MKLVCLLEFKADRMFIVYFIVLGEWDCLY